MATRKKENGKGDERRLNQEIKINEKKLKEETESETKDSERGSENKRDKEP